MQAGLERDARLDFERLAGYLDALANASRLELLHLLRTPSAVGDIHLRPGAGEADGPRPERNITRQGVRKHLAKLEETGLITTQRGRRDGAVVEEHVVNHQMLFAVSEELRRVTRVVPTVQPASAATLTGGSRDAGSKAKGARLIVVHGGREGQTFTLDPRTRAPERGWVVGRRRGLGVSLDYDPFVSQEHAEVLPRGDRYEVLDLRSNKNGTEVNWETLPRGGSATLSTGDVIGVGRSLLLFRAD
jgi:DNA-binding transcriptional ArsR family regulator